MFKEALAGIFILFLFYMIIRFLWKKNHQAASALAIVILIASCLANIIYNGIVMFPDFYMDTVSGVYRYGTFRGNLFAYSDEFMFQDEILFPILRGRSVLLDEAGCFYEKFFSLYADSYEMLPITESEHTALFSRQEDFDFSHEFTCIGIMDYVTEAIPRELEPDFEAERYPALYINTASLQGQSRLVAVMADDYSLYIMGKAYYEEVTGGNHHA